MEKLRNPPPNVFIGGAHPQIGNCACVNRRRPSWFDNRRLYHTAHYIARLSVCSASSSAPAYSVDVVWMLGGVIISQGAVRAEGISETPTEACSLRFSTTGLRKASGLRKKFPVHCGITEEEFWGIISLSNRALYRHTGPARGTIPNGKKVGNQLDTMVCLLGDFIFASSLVASTLHLLHSLCC